MHKVKEIKDIKPYKLYLKFNTGEYKIIDLTNKLKRWSTTKSSPFKKLLNPDYFKKAKLEHDWGTISWDNGIDFCPDVLYEWGIKINDK